MSQLFVLSYARGKAWLPGKSVFEQPLKNHLAYMQNLKARQVLVAGGPYLDDLGGLIVVSADTQESADSIWKNDPAVMESVMVAEAHPWMLMAGADILQPVVT